MLMVKARCEVRLFDHVNMSILLISNNVHSGGSNEIGTVRRGGTERSSWEQKRGSAYSPKKRFFDHNGDINTE